MMIHWENLFIQKIKTLTNGEDAAHDFLHFQRVVHTAKKLSLLEGGKQEIIIPAAWLHDFVIVPKNSPLRNQASRLASEAALIFLKTINYPTEFLDDIAHAIEAHSFSANIEARTLEAKIVQDADRLDGLGSIGIARCFATTGLLKRPFYSETDPLCENRNPDDSQYAVDHFYKKLFKIAETLKTKSALAEGKKRVEIMKIYLNALAQEI